MLSWAIILLGYKLLWDMESIVAPPKTLCETNVLALLDVHPTGERVIWKKKHFVMLYAQCMPKSHKLGIILTSILLNNDADQ